MGQTGLVAVDLGAEEVVGAKKEYVLMHNGAKSSFSGRNSIGFIGE